MTKPGKQDGTMELDVGQIDLLDLPLPPSSGSAAAPEEAAEAKKESEEEGPETARVTKGPPPLPLSMPPMPMLEPPPPPQAISARTLVGSAAPAPGSSITRFLLGMGAATAVCVIAVLAYRSTHKTPLGKAPTPTQAANATSAMTAPTQAFTMAPIEFTAPVSSDVEPQTSASPAPSAVRTGSVTGLGAVRPIATPSATTTKPKRDDVIKVEN